MTRKTQQEKQKEKLIDELFKDYDGPESFWGDRAMPEGNPGSATIYTG